MADEPITNPGDVEDAPFYTRTDKVARARSRTIRLVVLVVILVGITILGYLHQVVGAGKPVGVDALCPFGGIETLWSLIRGAGLIQRIAASSVILLLGTLAVAFAFRRTFCGYFCALGALQELFGRIGKAIWPRDRPEMPAAIDAPARYLKYAVLAFFTVWTFQAAALVIRPYDPWVAWMHLSSAELFAQFGIGGAILGISLIGSIVYERFFCKYLCPMGAFLGLIAPLSLFRVRRDDESCISCSRCDRACPVNIEVSSASVVDNPECINCNECVNVCPVADTLTVTSPGARGTTLTPNMVLGAASAIFAVIIGVTTVAGAFAWTVPSLAATVQATGGVINVEDIKGSMTFDEAAAVTGISAEAFQTYFGVTAEDMSLPMKDSAAKYGFDFHTDVREWIRLQLGTRATGASTVTSTGAGAAPATED